MELPTAQKPMTLMPGAKYDAGYQKADSVAPASVSDQPCTDKWADLDGSCHKRVVDISEQHWHLEADMNCSALVDATTAAAEVMR